MDTHSSAPVPPPGCPAHGGRVPLYGAEFAADPQSYYDYLRHYGPTAPVEIAPGVEATLVTEYSAALQLLQDPSSYRRDSRRWRDLNEGRIPMDSPVLPLLVYRPNTLFTDGAEHLRLRQTITDCLARIDQRRLARTTRQTSDFLIAQFGYRGSADLLSSYAKQLPLFVFNQLFGCPADIGDRVMFGIAGMFDGINAEKAAQVMFGAIGELIALKRSRPGDDVTSWMLQHHANLTDEEMTHQLAVLLGAGAEPLGNLIGNTLHRLLTHDTYAHQGGLIDEAIDDTLWENPPITNLGPHYPAADGEFAGQKVQAGELLMVSYAAANSSPILAAERRASSRAHLAWSAGPHACPAKDPARQIAMTALENLFNQLPDIELAVPGEMLSWRPGPFNRALVSLPARFTPDESVRRPQAATEAPAKPAQSAKSTEKIGRWSQFLNWLAK
ncbi:MULTISPECIES: cytochrome P450 [Kitasatospora]|uniref:Putative cytochrome P450 n=1 Tax=Kitasatospora setae (strain ATCC 33774 / DSM 43861 / JCM 3304 / KCC A-0304 / NBRC 14216 / KM-6054) TaxID=452652 RepID=E4NEF3_KITSK|nr:MULTISPECIES: cytochrome P450 [Kitasatospora]BAJ29584.1 putative cytochrome P450 [Kitasatospora setae KM-6054]